MVHHIFDGLAQQRGEDGHLIHRQLALVFPDFVHLLRRKAKRGRHRIACEARLGETGLEPFLIEKKRH